VFYGVTIPYYPSPDLINQYCNFHIGVVKNLNDPMGRGRVKIEVPGLLGDGKKNWSDWVEVGGTVLGTSVGDGDVGMWWPVELGSAVMIGFISGDPFAWWVIPGPPCQESREENTQMIPKEPKALAASAPRKGTRCKIIKSESGHTILMDDNGKSELFALLNWTGSGLAIAGPGKVEDESENEEDESKPRKNTEKRGIRNVFDGSSGSPSQLCDGNVEVLGLLDLIQQGIVTIAQEGGGIVGICARKGDGSVGPSIVLDAEHDVVLIQAGETQIQLRGDTDEYSNRIFVTKQMILESVYQSVANVFSVAVDKIKGLFSRYSG
jgi:hypothetical protein